MTSNRIRQLLTGEFKKFVNTTEIARSSGMSRQSLRYWIKEKPKNPKKSPQMGMLKLKTLSNKIYNSDVVSEDTYDKWKKFVNMSVLAQKFCDCSSSTMAVTIKRKSLQVYNSELKQMAEFILEYLKRSDPDVKSGKNVDIKLKLP